MELGAEWGNEDGLNWEIMGEMDMGSTRRRVDKLEMNRTERNCKMETDSTAWEKNVE